MSIWTNKDMNSYTTAAIFIAIHHVKMNWIKMTFVSYNAGR